MADGDALTDGEAMVVAARVQNPEAELAVLGAVLLDPRTLADVSERLRPHHFGTLKHRLVYEAMLRLHEAGEGIDVITLAESLRKAGDLAKAGNVAFLATLDGHVPSVGADPMRYVAMVTESYARRRIREAANGMARQALDREEAVDDIIGAAEQALVEVSEDRGLGGDLPSLKESVTKMWDALQVLFDKQKDVPGIATGITDLDMATTGLYPGELAILGGRAGMGKTSVGLQWARHIAEHHGPVGVFSLEMSREQLLKRLLSNEGRVDGTRMLTGKLLDSDFPKLARASDRLYKIPLVIDDSPRCTLHSIRARARAIQRAHGSLGALMIDYLQLVQPENLGRDANREQQVASISRGLKLLARQLNVPIIALAQLNRALERSTNKRPGSADLRESSSLEMDSDLIVMIYRDEIYNPDTADKGIAELIITKNRRGPTRTVRTAFLAEYTRIENLASDDRVPTRDWRE